MMVESTKTGQAETSFRVAAFAGLQKHNGCGFLAEMEDRLSGRIFSLDIDEVTEGVNHAKKIEDPSLRIDQVNEYSLARDVLTTALMRPKN